MVTHIDLIWFLYVTNLDGKGSVAYFGPLRQTTSKQGVQTISEQLSVSCANQPDFSALHSQYVRLRFGSGRWRSQLIGIQRHVFCDVISCVRNSGNNC
jgi:hypothetical protein